MVIIECGARYMPECCQWRCSSFITKAITSLLDMTAQMPSVAVLSLRYGSTCAIVV